jgi:hypothetical protein
VRTVRKLGPKRFLADEAPRFPLPECSSAWRCKCIYRHFPDRRAGPRRAGERDGLLMPRIGAERRQRDGRRADDSADLGEILLVNGCDDDRLRR